jgi:hypothetical protein
LVSQSLTSESAPIFFIVQRMPSHSDGYSLCSDSAVARNSAQRAAASLSCPRPPSGEPRMCFTACWVFACVQGVDVCVQPTHGFPASVSHSLHFRYICSSSWRIERHRRLHICCTDAISAQNILGCVEERGFWSTSVSERISIAEFRRPCAVGLRRSDDTIPSSASHSCTSVWPFPLGGWKGFGFSADLHCSVGALNDAQNTVV